jgi:hypothetical protein
VTEYGRKHTEEKALIARAELDRVIEAEWDELDPDRAAAWDGHFRVEAAAQENK